jgi:AraC-like DNA-binding protein
MQTNVDHSGKGILNLEAGKQKFLITRHAPSPELAPFILRYWVARWDLRGEPPYRQVVLSHPNVSERLPQADDSLDLACRIVETIERERVITKVDDVVSRFGCSKRTIQRLFDKYVGVTPKWVIQRYRLHEAAMQMEKGLIPDWAKLSVDLGYYDQAHFIKDFKAVLGRSPEEYIRAMGAGGVSHHG